MDRIKEVQEIIKKGCATNLPYLWCSKCDEKAACWRSESKEICQLFEPKPDEEVIHGE